MILERTTASINKAEDAGRTDAPIGFDDALRRVFQTALPSLDSRGWIDQETLCIRMSKHILVAMRPKRSHVPAEITFSTLPLINVN